MDGGLPLNSVVRIGSTDLIVDWVVKLNKHKALIIQRPLINTIVPCLLPVFVVRVSLTFHLTCVHIFSTVSVAEWPPFGEYLLIRLTICSLLYFDYL